MSSNNTTAPQQSKTELVSQYRPLGLKAVTAAHLMLKRKPTKKSV